MKIEFDRYVSDPESGIAEICNGFVGFIKALDLTKGGDVIYNLASKEPRLNCVEFMASFIAIAGKYGKPNE